MAVAVPLNAVAGAHIEFAVVDTVKTGTTLLSMTNWVALFSQPVVLFWTSTVYGVGEVNGPPTFIAVTWSKLLAGRRMLAGTTAFPLCHLYPKTSPGATLVTATVTVPSGVSELSQLLDPVELVANAGRMVFFVTVIVCGMDLQWISVRSTITV